jgi:hypothetical protein
MNVLVLQPIRPDHPPELRQQAAQLLHSLHGANGDMVFDIVQDDAKLDIPAHTSRYIKHATVRNYMVNRYLTGAHDAVFWIDSDLISYDADLPARLHAANSGGITAPLALLAEPNPYGRDRFYDIGGFVERGRSARPYPPYFDQQGDVISLESVGCCYLIPATVYHQGVRYAPPPCDRWMTAHGAEYRVEHNSVMLEARRLGYSVRCLTTARCVHAWLPNFGLNENG